MSETLLTERQETPQRPEWRMPSKRGGFETAEEIHEDVRARTRVLGEFEPAVEGPVIGFIYDPQKYDTHIEVRDSDYALYDVDLTLLEFLDARDDQRADRWQEVDAINDDIYQTCFDKVAAYHWWQNREAVENRIDPTYIDAEPTEQIIAGQEGRGVRFFNYGDAMTDARRDDCRKAVEMLAQYFGDHVYDVLQDVVIVPFKDNGKVEHNGEEGHVNGFTRAELPGVVFLNDRLLPDDAQEPHYRLQDEEGVTQFLETLLHEFGHLLHGFGEEADEDLLNFAREVGWDVDAMRREAPHWSSGHYPLDNFIPPDDYMVTHEDGSRERVPMGDYYDKYDKEYDDNGKVIQEAKPFTRLGSPTSYGETSPQETFADTGAFLMLGDFVVRQFPETRDAWLAHAQKRLGDRPLGVVPVDRAPVIADHRTGNDILYPATPLPANIFVRVLPRAV